MVSGAPDATTGSTLRDSINRPRRAACRRRATLGPRRSHFGQMARSRENEDQGCRVDHRPDGTDEDGAGRDILGPSGQGVARPGEAGHGPSGARTPCSASAQRSRPRRLRERSSTIPMPRDGEAGRPRRPPGSAMCIRALRCGPKHDGDAMRGGADAPQSSRERRVLPSLTAARVSRPPGRTLPLGSGGASVAARGEDGHGGAGRPPAAAPWRAPREPTPGAASPDAARAGEDRPEPRDSCPRASRAPAPTARQRRGSRRPGAPPPPGSGRADSGASG